MQTVQFVKSAVIRRVSTRLVYKVKPFLRKRSHVVRFTTPPPVLRTHDADSGSGSGEDDSMFDECSCLFDDEETSNPSSASFPSELAVHVADDDASLEQQQEDQSLQEDHLDQHEQRKQFQTRARTGHYECKCKRHAAEWPKRKRLVSSIPRETSCGLKPVLLVPPAAVTLCSRTRYTKPLFGPLLCTSPVYLSARYEVWSVLRTREPSCRYHLLVRACLLEFGIQWVTLAQIEVEAEKVGMSLPLDTHVMQCSQYGAGDHNDPEAWGHYFPYFEMGFAFTKHSPQRVYMWRVAPEFEVL